MLITLGEAKDSTLANIASGCTNGSQFLGWLNEATRRLMRRGDWAGTVVPMYFCVFRGCVVMPRYVGRIRKINHCRQRPIAVHNMYWDFVPESVYPWDSCLHSSHVGAWHPWAAQQTSLTAMGYSPVLQDIMGDLRLVRAYPRCQADAGKTITLFGLDNNGQPLMTHNPDDTWSEGVIITLGFPFASTATFVRQVDRVIKQPTNCPVDLFAYNATEDVLEELAHYEPSEINPRLAKYTLGGGSCGTSWTGCKQGVIALVKLAFVPAAVDTDLVLIQNLDALKLMIQSAKFGEAGDIANARQYEIDAIRELNRELEDETPDQEIPVSQNPFASSGIGEMHCF